MLVLDMNAFIFEITVITCSLNNFSSELGIAEIVPIVDGEIAYYQYSHQTYILIIFNALYITTIKNNITPPFLRRVGGVIVDDIIKIHFKDPTSSDHCI